MEALVYLDLSTKQLTESLGGSTWSFPTLSYGEDATLSLRFARREAGVISEVSREVTALQCSIGRVDARPESGKWGFEIVQSSGDIVSDLQFNVKGADIATEINALTLPAGLGECTVEEKSGSYLIRWEDETVASTDTPVAIVATSTNSLFPISFIRHRTFQENGMWVHELRLIQAPVASTSSSSRVLPPEPSITTAQNGGTDEGSGAVWNEEQDLYIPPGFRGLYRIRRGFKRTGLLDLSDGVTQISEALEGLADDGGTFVVTNPQTDHALIEFTGEMGGIDQDELTIEVHSAPEGDLTFTLNLDRPELSALLRREAEVTLPIELTGTLTDVDDEEISHRRRLYYGEVTIRRELHWEELSSAQNIEWLRPPLNEVYGGFDYSQVSNGQLHFADSYGDGVATAIVVDHNLDASDVGVIVKNNATGALLVLGTSYTVTVTNSNSLTVTSLIGAPATNNWRIVVHGLEETSYFDPHTHPIEDITGLQAIIDALGERLDALELLAPSGVTLARSASVGTFSRSLGSIWTVPRARTNPTKPDQLLNWTISAKELGETPRRPLRLLPAVHDAATETIPVAPLPTPSASYAGRVFTTAADRTDFPGGGLLAGDFAACDGREWYRVARIGSESSYYPVGFETTLFEVAVNSSEFILGSQIDLNFGIETAVIMLEKKARSQRSACSWSLILEVGSHTADASPGTPGSNLAAGFSSAITLLEQRLVLTEIPSYHTFGAIIERSTGGTLTATAIKYGEESATTAPDSANLALRARLIRFDTENAPTDARGIVAVRGLDVDLSGQTDVTLGKLIITK